MKMTLGLFVLPGLLFSATLAQPLVKNGECPAKFERQVQPTEERWSGFNAVPTPTDSFPTGTTQLPQTPQVSLNCSVTPSGLKMELWASESMQGNMKYIQDFTFDERGRVWAVEPMSYPNTIRPASGTTSDQKFVGGADRIVIMEDTDGDKVMDSFKEFKTGLNLPQGIEVVNGGVVVAMVPYIVFFPNNNDVAGPAQILFSGLGPNGNYDTHGGINTLRYGLDNWIYGQTGYNTPCKAVPTNVTCGKGSVWRFRHTALGHAKTEFQVWAEGIPAGSPQNAHGFGQMEDGQIFQAGATSSSHMNHSVLQGSAGIDIRDGNGGPANVYYPITGDRYLAEGSTKKDSHGWFTSQTTAVSGLEFYTSRLFPKKYWNRFAFTCEGASKLCNQDSLVESSKNGVIGSTWRALRLPGPDRANIVASKDAWFAPIESRTGPDGALWVLDWNNYLFLHNPLTPSGPGGAWENSLREKHSNRIYRIVPGDGSLEPVLNLSNATEDQLVATFSNPNMLWRLHAQRLLLSKGYSAALGDKLQAILETDKSVDAVENNGRVLAALWTLQGLGQFDSDPTRWNPILARLLQHPAWGVRRNVLRAMPRTAATAKAISDKCSMNDPHGHVRLQAMVALGEIGSARPTGLKTILTAYSNVDASASTAFAASGLVAAAAAPCTVTLDTSTVSVSGSPSKETRIGLKFALRPDGFYLPYSGRLVSGTLTVYSLHGQTVFRSSYDAVSGRWSKSSAQGLMGTVYGYSFQGSDGSTLQGRISILTH